MRKIVSLILNQNVSIIYDDHSHKTLNYKRTIEEIRQNGADEIRVVIPSILFSRNDDKFVNVCMNRVHKLATCSSYENNVKCEIKHDINNDMTITMKGTINRKKTLHWVDKNLHELDDEEE